MRLNPQILLCWTCMETTIGKIQKHLDSLKCRNDKLAEENQKLKATISELKSLNSRVRRIPKSTAAPSNSKK